MGAKQISVVEATNTALTPDAADAVVQELAENARVAYRELAESKGVTRNLALREAANALREDEVLILQANVKDVEAARAANMNAALVDRLSLTEERIETMAAGLEDIAQLEDPLAGHLGEWDRPNGLRIRRAKVPLGVIGMIYESRPNVTADASALCIKSGNAVILRGGSDSAHSSAAILASMQRGLKAAGLPEMAVQAVPTYDREVVGAMLRASGLIDVIIPRGGKSLTSRVQAESRVPTLLHLDGNCHTYIHAGADEKMAVSIVHNAKLRRPGICGATESLVIDQAIAPKVLPKIATDLQAAGCELRGDVAACSLVSSIQPASEEDWGTEYLDKVVSIKIVAGMEEAIAHVNRYSSHHTDCIITDDRHDASAFLQRIDSAIVMHNTSTQFADGGEFGMGAEIGIATGRLHARGPVGAAQLVTYKYIVESDGAARP